MAPVFRPIHVPLSSIFFPFPFECTCICIFTRTTHTHTHAPTPPPRQGRGTRKTWGIGCKVKIVYKPLTVRNFKQVVLCHCPALLWMRLSRCGFFQASNAWNHNIGSHCCLPCYKLKIMILHALPCRSASAPWSCTTKHAPPSSPSHQALSSCQDLFQNAIQQCCIQVQLPWMCGCVLRIQLRVFLGDSNWLYACPGCFWPADVFS